MLENLAPPSWKIPLPHEKFINGKIFPSNPLPTTFPPPGKIPTENVCILGNNIYYMQAKQLAKFTTFSRTPGDCGGLNHPQRHSY
jgi:hypothetical protein